MNFGQLLYFYKYLDDSLKNKIAKDFSLFLIENLTINSIQLTSNSLISYLENVIDLRNVVAHNNRILGFQCKGHVRYLSQLHDKYSISNDSVKQDVYHVYIIMQALLTENQYALLHNTLIERTNYLRVRLNTITINTILRSLGFPVNWYVTPKIPLSDNRMNESLPFNQYK